MYRSLLVAFDFDHTISDGNTDIVVRNLLPDEKLPNGVRESIGTDGWIPYMRKIFELLHGNCVDVKRIEDAITNIPAVPGIDELLRELHSRGSEIIIISDSNSLFIQRWLQSKKLEHVVNKTFTNPAYLDSNGTIKVDMYHVQNWCELSSENICKGHILKSYIESRAAAGVPFNRVAYVGDGKNDFCPILTLSEDDLAFPRIGYALTKLLSDPEGNKVAGVKAQVVPWTNGTDVLRKLDEVFKIPPRSAYAVV